MRAIIGTDLTKTHACQPPGWAGPLCPRHTKSPPPLFVCLCLCVGVSTRTCECVCVCEFLHMCVCAHVCMFDCVCPNVDNLISNGYNIVIA